MAVKPREGSGPSMTGGAASSVRVALEWTTTPQQAALLVREDPVPFALIGRWAGGGAVIGSAPVRIAPESEDPFALLDDQPWIAARDPRLVGGGWFGWLGYPLARALEPVDPGPPHAAGSPPFQLAYYDHVLHLDHQGRWWFEALWTERRGPELRKRLAELRERATKERSARPVVTEPWRFVPSAAGHSRAVGACRERIRAGDLFQANICARLESRVEGEPIDLFVTAFDQLRPDRAAFIGGADGAVVSLSPELFLERHGRLVRSAPIKGTRARPRDPELASRARTELIGSHKDRAENIMIVDLVRNDLGRVCERGSVRVDALAQARPHTGVWHLVSEVSGTLRDGVGNADLVRAAFPPGSVSGAPKIAAMNVIAELESTARELYTGAIGFASPLLGLELSVAIRTFEFRGDRAWLGVGGGIVADSDPAAEAAECIVKAAPLLEAIDASFAASPAAPPAFGPTPARIAPRPIPRPDPTAGVFETLLARDGRPVALEQHLRRLGASVSALYRSELPPSLEQALTEAASGLETARLRVEVRPDRDGVLFEIAVSPLPERPPLRLRPVAVPGGLGPHKWIDRRLLAALSEHADGEPLLCDLDGLVLEAAKANVFGVEGSARLLTPPLDGRILPGVTRAAVIELAPALGFEVREEPLGLARLAAGTEIFVTGSLGGVEPATLARGGPSGSGAATARIAAAWRARSAQLRPGPAPLPA